MKIFKKFKGLILAFTICFVLPFTLFFIINEFVLDNNKTFSTGYTLCGIDIGGLSLYQAEEKFNSLYKIEDSPISLEICYNDKKWIFNESDFQIKTNIHTILEQAYKSNHKTTYLNKIKNAKKIKKMGFNPKVAVNYSLLGIDQKIDQICSEIETEPINSEISYNKTNKNFDITKSFNGIKVDKEKLYKDISLSMQKNNLIKIQVSTTPILPSLTEKDLIKCTKKQSSFTTNYVSSNFERKNNIKIATSSLNGFCIKPNEEFSFNSAIGQRSLEKGYKQANIIKDGAFVKGIGGGVCQVSSTLYNALLLSNIDVTESHKHSLPVGYVNPGLDAMVSWGTADLKFTNTTNLPIFIVSSCDGKNLNFSIYGDTKSDNLNIKTNYEIIKKIPHSGDKIVPDIEGTYSDKILFKGEYFRYKYPKDGYEAKTYLEYYIDGKFSHKKQIRHATYASQQGIVYEGCESLPEGMTLPKDNFTKYPNAS